MLLPRFVQRGTRLFSSARTFREVSVPQELAALLASDGGQELGPPRGARPDATARFAPSLRLPALMQVSDDPQLSRTRELLLRSFGFQVTTVPSGHFEAACRRGPVSSVLLCHTIGSELASRTADLVRELLAPGVITMRLTYTPHLEIGSYDYMLMAPVLPRVLAHESIKLQSPITSS